MYKNNTLTTAPPVIQPLSANWLTNKNIHLGVLRMDLVHPVVSGNKWYKLKYYLEDAIALQKDAVATFGGAWSNHIVACAFACKEAGLHSIGIIRGERPPVLSDTLINAMEFGMKLQFVSREAFRNKAFISEHLTGNNPYVIPEGGYGALGMKGASEILQSVNASAYDHIIAAVGTGTMLAGLLLSAGKNQKVTGVSSMKGNEQLHNQVKQLTGGNTTPAFEIIHGYHFGGYGKHPQELIDFMNEIYLEHNLPLDVVYTSKTLYAIKDLADKSYFQPGEKLLMIHSGGLQGNRSLAPKVLAF